MATTAQMKLNMPIITTTYPTDANPERRREGGWAGELLSHGGGHKAPPLPPPLKRTLHEGFDDDAQAREPAGELDDLKQPKSTKHGDVGLPHVDHQEGSDHHDHVEDVPRFEKVQLGGLAKGRELDDHLCRERPQHDELNQLERVHVEDELGLTVHHRLAHDGDGGGCHEAEHDPVEVTPHDHPAAQA